MKKRKIDWVIESDLALRNMSFEELKAFANLTGVGYTKLDRKDLLDKLLAEANEI